VLIDSDVFASELVGIEAELIRFGTEVSTSDQFPLTRSDQNALMFDFQQFEHWTVELAHHNLLNTTNGVSG
jgi:hypothetical protein